ncbi:D-alanyl-D-alanine endopeptidase [Noviherbaspirillum malthae]|jgi:D-alanyl-D-alanine endopeptidase (penicillin-binding protein 7)|uniref:D-alanyl-D-alanine endopeptidase n=1 Tax=Noviherbaspirillum malthae TaxID=1260987 RepID=UPI0018905DD9|nr:D-alanyl-D-alanine endopeptidase [Noviherbaspirillum malthae]
MVKSALGIVISLFAFAVASPAVHAQGSAAAKSGKKQVVKKQVAKKPVAKTASAKVKTSVERRSGKKVVQATAVRSAVAVKAKPNSGYQRVAFSPSPNPAAAAVPPVMTAGDMAGLNLTHDPLSLKSNAAVVIDQRTSQVLFEKNAAVPLPIASLTKLMTAMIVVESRQNMDEVLEVTTDDIDREKNSTSRLRVGSHMSRANMLHIALMSSENRAASALGRNYPGGLPAFVAAMNAKAKALGMMDTRYVDSTGLSSHNVASARDLARLVVAAYQYPVIRDYSTDENYAVDTGNGHQLQYMNSNRLVKNPGWDIGLQKTGYISEAGRCLLMQSRIDGRPVVMVFLDSKGKDSRLADAGRVRKWLESTKPQTLVQVQAAAR